MGNLWTCDKCPTNVTSSVVNFSDAIILRVTEGTELPKAKEDPTPKDELTWIETIRCLDEVHSRQYGLSLKELGRYIEVVEQRMQVRPSVQPCFVGTLLRCYTDNPKCPLACIKERLAFIDCVEEARLERVRLAAEQYYLSKRQKPKGCEPKKHT